MECLIWITVTFTVDQSIEIGDTDIKWDEFTLHTGELFSHEEWLGQEFLDLSGSGDGELIFFRKFVHTENSDDILEGLVILQDLLSVSSNLVMSKRYKYKAYCSPTMRGSNILEVESSGSTAG